MNTKINYLLVFALIFIAFSCNNKNAKNKIEASDSQQAVQSDGGQKLVVDTLNSFVHWRGFKPGGSHQGSLGIKSGEIFIDGTALKSGSFILDMNNIIDEDLTIDQGRDKLIKHLKSADFFDVQKFPEGKFIITKAEKLPTDNVYRISGNLELKGTLKNITFDAKITKEGDIYKAQTDTFSIDRTQWGVNYGSKNIFKDLKDKFIHDEMEVTIVIAAS